MIFCALFLTATCHTNIMSNNFQSNTSFQHLLGLLMTYMVIQ